MVEICGVLCQGQLRQEDDLPLGQTGLQSGEAGQGLATQLRLPLQSWPRQSEGENIKLILLMESNVK